MVKIDFKDIYLGGIDQINIDIEAAINKIDWKSKAKLETTRYCYHWILSCTCHILVCVGIC